LRRYKRFSHTTFLDCQGRFGLAQKRRHPSGRGSFGPGGRQERFTRKEAAVRSTASLASSPEGKSHPGAALSYFANMPQDVIEIWVGSCLFEQGIGQAILN
jgi:hypothetical protein